MFLWGLGFAFYGISRLIPEKDKGQIEELNTLLDNKGYVKFYDADNKIYGIELKLGSSFNDLEKLKGAMENALKNEVNVINDNYRYFIQLVEPRHIPTLVPFQVVDTRQHGGLIVAVAVGENEIIYLDFSKVPHTLIAGATGWGKSVFTNNLILQIINNFPDAEFELFDFKGGAELGDYRNLKQTHSFTIQPDIAEGEINRIYQEIQDRYDLVSDYRNWIRYNAKNEKKLNPKFVFIEEFTVLIDQSKEMKNTLTKSLAISRAAGVFFIFTSQRFSADIIDSKIKANIDNRICFHTADSINSKIILDVTGAEKLKVIGRCLISVGGVIKEGQSFFVEDNDVEKQIQSHLKSVSKTKSDKIDISKVQNKKAHNEPTNDENRGNSLWV